jgi:hypothetical protein
VILINRSPVAEYYWYFYRGTIRTISIAELGRFPPPRSDEALQETRALILSTVAAGRRVLLSGIELSDPPGGARGQRRLPAADVRRFVDGLPLSRNALFTFEIDGTSHTMYELVRSHAQTALAPKVLR